MKITPALVFTTITGLIFGVGFMIIPNTLMRFLVDTSFTPAHELLTRLYGSASFFVGLVALVGLWFEGEREKRLITYAMLGFLLPQGGLIAWGVVEGSITVVGWVIAGVAGLQALFFAFGLRKSTQ